MNQPSWKNFCQAIICLMVIVGPAIVRPPTAHAVPLPGFTGYSDMGVAIVIMLFCHRSTRFTACLSVLMFCRVGNRSL